MDYRNHAAPDRGCRPTQGVEVPIRFEWTRQPKVGPSLHILGDLLGRTVVELGCGSGHNLAHLAVYQGVIGVGVDHDPAKICRAYARYGHIPNICFVLADCNEYLRSISPRSVDIFLSIFGAFSFADPLTLLVGTKNALRSDGLLALTLRADDQHDLVVLLRRS